MLAVLAAYPDGLSLGELAARFDSDPGTVREDLTTYLDLESWGWSFDLFRRSVIEFIQPEADDAQEPHEGDSSTLVRLVSRDPAGSAWSTFRPVTWR